MPFQIPLLKERNKDKKILWVLVRILPSCEEVWYLISTVPLQQSKWHGSFFTNIYKKL